MSEASKAARKALKSKAHRLAEPHKGAVDASGWTEPTDEGAGVQTGMRPVSKRQYKRGGKVKMKAKHHLGHAEGEKAVVRADRKPRKAGGKAEMPPVDRFINADKKKANEYRDGPKHVGGMKTGGRAKKMDGGPMMAAGGVDPRVAALLRAKMAAAPAVDPRVAALARAKLAAAQGAPAGGVDPRVAAALLKARAAGVGAPTMKKGGRTKKFGGGAMGGGGGMGNQMFNQGMAAAQGGMGQQGYAQQAQPMAQQAQPMARYAVWPGAQGLPGDATRHHYRDAINAYHAARSAPQHLNAPPPQAAPAAYSPPAMQAAPAQQQPQAQQQPAAQGYANAAQGMMGMGQQGYGQAMGAAQGMAGLGNQVYNQGTATAAAQAAQPQQAPAAAAPQQSMPFTQASWANNNLGSMAGQSLGGLGNQMFGQGAAAAGGMGGGKPGGFKRGGRTMHDDEAADRALVKKMVKPSARTGKAKGGETEMHHSSCRCHKCMGGRMARKDGGLVKIFIQDRGANPPQNDGGPPGMAPRPPFQQEMKPAPQGGPGGPPPGPPQGAPPPPPPPPAPPPGPGPQQGPPVGPDGRPLPPPGPYKRGGRANYPNMEYGGGGGKGRLEKIKEYGP